MKCEICGFNNPCVSPKTRECRECNHDFKHCIQKCKYPCRSREEQEKVFSKMDKDWKSWIEN